MDEAPTYSSKHREYGAAGFYATSARVPRWQTESQPRREAAPALQTPFSSSPEAVLRATSQQCPSPAISHRTPFLLVHYPVSRPPFPPEASFLVTTQSGKLLRERGQGTVGFAALLCRSS